MPGVHSETQINKQALGPCLLCNGQGQSGTLCLSSLQLLAVSSCLLLVSYGAEPVISVNETNTEFSLSISSSTDFIFSFQPLGTLNGLA